MFNNQQIDLFWQLLVSNFRLRYKNSILGFVWVLLKPAVIFFVLLVIWGVVSDTRIHNYPQYLLLGVIIYNYVNEAILLCLKSLLERSHIILKVNFNRSLTVWTAATLALVNFLIGVVLFFVYSVVSGLSFSLEGIIYFVFLVISSFIALTGIGFFTSILYIKLRDLDQLTELFMFLLFWATPIFYTSDQLFLKTGVRYDIAQIWFTYNPLALFINEARQALILGQVGNITVVFIYTLISIGLLFAGNAFFNHHIKKITEEF